MPRQENEPLTLHSMYLFQGDYEKLKGIYGDKLPAAKIIRILVRKLIKRVEAEREKIALPQSPHEFDLKDITPEDMKNG